MKTAGTTPRGAVSEEQAARWVQGMFGRVAHRYDFLNHLLSFQLDRRWRAFTVKQVRPILMRPDARVLDLCCGTGDLMLALERERGGPVLGSDFCHPMLIEARSKSERRSAATELVNADALRMPFADASLDLITVAFGFRNFANYRKGLRELRRLLRPGGCLAILEFSQPPNRAFAALYRFYSRQVLPRIGALLSGDRDAYSYLPESVQKFPGPEDLAREMRLAGFTAVTFRLLSFGIVALHLGYAGENPHLEETA
ncbi:MAG: bifunctional demethylmenaquinone methyltransferase/2-methoxy-6-polyprenyl-1,4-benzoquinol methylase UbiE [Bryobacteraceae bacterium]|nr:bifunctional demethylmenaquinone methyltransferase/2-methoxy-6-polyprenyl-1,4-benzoquinol methylase UbiE [Bryobacteraceae bacterium]